jgi:hypothetical protein
MDNLGLRNRSIGIAPQPFAGLGIMLSPVVHRDGLTTSKEVALKYPILKLCNTEQTPSGITVDECTAYRADKVASVGASFNHIRVADIHDNHRRLR